MEKKKLVSHSAACSALLDRPAVPEVRPWIVWTLIGQALLLVGCSTGESDVGPTPVPSSASASEVTSVAGDEATAGAHDEVTYDELVARIESTAPQ